MAKHIDGKEISAKIKRKIAREVALLEADVLPPSLAVILVGENTASKIYVRNKSEACQEVGIRSEQHHLPSSTSEEKLIALIDELNGRKDINGILLQLPLPFHLHAKNLIQKINSEKDVDAFCASNVGRIMANDYAFLPCTPAGVIEMLKHENIEIDGKMCVVVGRSNIVGKPMAMLLLHKNGTVTICHRHTKNLKDICLQADILVCAVGKVGLITADMVKPGAVVIDVGMNRDSNGKLCGDVCFAEVEKKASYITPVPGGVGPMTIAMLLNNTLAAFKIQNNIH